MRMVRVLTAGAWFCLGIGSGLACSSDDDDPQNGTPVRFVAPLEGAVSDVHVQAGQTENIIFTLQLPPDFRNVAAVDVDLKATLDHVDIDGLPLLVVLARQLAAGQNPFGGHNASAIIRVGSDPATVCESPIAYGPFQVTHSTELEIAPETQSADGPTLEIINSGSMVMCVSITSTVDATFSVDDVEMDVTQEGCPTPANFAGTWVGVYNCGNGCGSPFGGDIEIVVTQNGTSASYTDDSDATFTGTVCGNRFRFERQTEGEIERGTLTLDDTGHATKRSTWRATSPPYCSGDCIDNLTRLTN